MRESVRDAIARYVWAADGGHAAELAECFTTSGVLDVGDLGGRWTGRDEIARQLAAVAERVAAAGDGPGPVRHHVSSVLVTPESVDTARARSYFAVHTAVGLDHWGRYYDQLRVQGGRWRFAERVVRLDGHSPGSLMVAGGAS